MNSFPLKFLEARKKSHLTCIALAEKLGVSRRAIYAWENGVSIPRKKMMIKIADTLESPSSISQMNTPRVRIKAGYGKIM